MAQFLDKVSATQLDCVSNSGRGTWRMNSELRFQSDILEAYLIGQGMPEVDAMNKSIITVPAGFMTDFMSVPPEVPDAEYLAQSKRAGAVHDFLYTASKDGTHPAPNRDIADRILREMFITDVTEGGGASTEEQRIGLFVRANLVYAGVRAGGESHWVT